MTEPLYLPEYSVFLKSLPPFEYWESAIPWAKRTTARLECFMSDEGGLVYTYGEGRGVRTYTSIKSSPEVLAIQAEVNQELAERQWGPVNGCFLNYYEGYQNALGWHSDNFHRMDHTCPVAVVSLGQVREIWWRPIGQTGETPPQQRQRLEHGSLFIMPPGFQHTHEHRIPKGDRQDMTGRISLTFRAFKDPLGVEP